MSCGHDDWRNMSVEKKQKPEDGVKKKKGTISSLIPRSPLKELEMPQLQKVATEIVADDPKYIPICSDVNVAVVDLIANLEPDHTGGKRLSLSHRATVVIDCGFSMRLPVGYKALVKARSDFASRGLIVTDGPSIIGPNNTHRVAVTVTNVGKEIIVVNDGDKIAQMWVEPSYAFEWIRLTDFNKILGIKT